MRTFSTTISLLLLSFSFAFLTIFTSCKKDNEPTGKETPDINLTKGLLAYYPFNGNANDESGNGNHGALFNGALISSDQTGNPSSALNVNGSNGVIVNDGGKLNPTDSMSVSFDVMVRNRGRQHFITRVNYNTGFGATLSIGTNIPNDQRLQFSTLKSGTPCDGYHTDADVAGRVWGILLENESWYSVVLTYKSGTYKLYINGILNSESTSPLTKINYCPNSNFMIGAWWKNDIAGLNGKMDNVRVYNRILNQDEISALKSGK